MERLGQVVSTTNDADRTFWLETCNDFAERRIAAVVNELRASDEEELGYAFESLLNLAQFFDAVRADACSDALRSLDATRFVPSTDDSVGPCLDAFYRRDPTVQRLLPEVLGATMDVITKAYQSGRRARQDARFASAAAPGPNAVIRRAEQLHRERAARLARSVEARKQATYTSSSSSEACSDADFVATRFFLAAGGIGARDVSGCAQVALARAAVFMRAARGKCYRSAHGHSSSADVGSFL